MLDFNDYTEITEAAKDPARLRSMLADKILQLDKSKLAAVLKVIKADEEEFASLISSTDTEVVYEKLKELFAARDISYLDGRDVHTQLARKIGKTQGTTADKIDFIDKMISGELFNSKPITGSGSGNIKSLVKPHPILNQILDWFVGWTGAIDSSINVSTGATEAFVILMSKNATKPRKGDIGIGNKKIEVKTLGGGLASNSINKSQKKALIAALAEMDIKADLPFLTWNQVHNASMISTISALLIQKGMSASSVETWWKKIFGAPISGKTFSAPITVQKDGTTDIEEMLRYAAIVAFAAYQEKDKFTSLLLLDKETGDFQSYTSAADFNNRSTSWGVDGRYGFDGGSRGGAGSPSIMFSSETFVNKPPQAGSVEDADNQYMMITSTLASIMPQRTGMTDEDKENNYQQFKINVKNLNINIDPKIDHTIAKRIKGERSDIRDIVLSIRSLHELKPKLLDWGEEKWKAHINKKSNTSTATASSSTRSPRKSKYDTTPEQQKQIKKLFAQGLSMAEVQRATGIDYLAIRKYRDDNNIAVKSSRGKGRVALRANATNSKYTLDIDYNKKFPSVMATYSYIKKQSTKALDDAGLKGAKRTKAAQEIKKEVLSKISDATVKRMYDRDFKESKLRFKDFLSD